MKKKSFLLLTFAFFLMTASLRYFQQKIKTSSYKGNLVIDVLDGDTFVIEESQRVRLLELDSPASDLCGGKEAKEFLENLILGKRVILDELVTDNFGRIMALAYLDRILINKKVLENGWGFFNGPKTSKGEELRLAYNKAKEERKGIYQPQCYPLEPSDPECLIKGNVNPKDKTRIYHFPGCSSYSNVIVERFLGEDWFCSEAEAEKAGFVKAETCYGKKVLQ